MKKIYTLLLALMMTGIGFGQDIVAISGRQTTNATTVANISANALSRGSGISSTGTSTFNSNGWTTSTSLDTNDYIEWSVTADPGFTVSVTNVEIDYDRSNSGPTNVSIRTSLDSFASDIFTDSSVSASGEVVSFSTSLTSTDGGTITFRLYAYDANTGGGTFDIEDDLGTVIGQTQTGVILDGTVDAVSSCTAPTTQATVYNTTALGSTSATLNWTSGNGDEVLVLVKEASAVDTDPTNGTSYTGNTTFESGTELGTGNYAVFAGTTASSVSVTGLDPSTTYHVAVYEYNTTGTCYLTPALTGNFTTSAVTTVQFSSTSTSVAETVGTYDLVIEIANEDAAATTFDVVLTSGSAADIDTYTTQSESFPGSSTTDITVTITVTDDAIFEADEVLTFEIQNVAGGNSAVVGTNNSFDLTIEANDAPTTGTLYDADFSTNGDGFAAHSSGSPPASGPASAGPFGTFPNQWTLSYVTTPATDGGGNSFEVSGGELQSRDWGGQGIFTSQVVNVNGVSSVDISATGLNVNANDGPFTYFYILDGGSRVETSISSSNGNPVNYSIIGLDVSGATTLEVGFEFSENGSNAGYDVSEYIVTAGCAAPSTQATAYNTTALGTTSATLNWTDGDGDEVLVLVKEGAAVDADPTSGTSYTANTIFTSGDQIGTGNYVVQSGSAASSVSITGLSAATTYHVAVYEYNTTDTCYLIPALTGSFTTDCSIPSDATAFTAVADNATVDLSWTNGACFDEILVVAKAASAVTVTPTGDGTTYTANAAFAAGTDLGTGEYAVYKGTGTSVTVTGLTNGTTYHFTAFARKITTWSAGVSDSGTPNLVEEAIAGDLIITEVSGDDSATGNDNGYMEIYNRSNKIINLDNIEARYFNSNPGNSTQEVTLSGTLSPGSYAIVTQNGTSYTTEFSDTADATGSSFFFNGGDDGCDVYHTSNGVIDQFNDNGSGQSPWNWNDNFTYKRNSSDSGAVQANWTEDGTNNNPRSKTNLYFWTGGTDTSWTATGNWDEGAAPTMTTDVVITDQTNEPSITSSAHVSHFTIESSSDVIVEKTGNLEIDGNLNNNGSLGLESDSNEYSSLIVDGTSNGTINYDRHVNINGSGTTGSNDLISAPLTGQAFSAFATANSNILSNGAGTLFLFGPFDKASGDYLTYADTESATLDAGVGYRAASDDNSTFTFTGTAENGDITYNITNGGPTEPEWNLVGNPYPSYLNVQDFLNHEVSTGISNIDLFDSGTEAIYGYDGNALNGWTIYNLANTTASTVIAPGQGFFVSANSTYESTYDLEFTPAMRSTGTTDDFIAGRNPDGTLVYLELSASTSSSAFSTQFYFNEFASLGFDLGFDAELFSIPTFALFSHLVEDNEDEPMQIQAVNTIDMQDVTFPLGLLAAQGVQVTFSIDIDALPSSTYVYLVDTEENITTDLRMSDYVFTPTTALTGTGRFFINMTENELSTIENSFDLISIANLNASKELVVRGQLQTNTLLNLYDIQGRKVISAQLDSTRLENRIDTSNISGGVYVVSVENDGQQKTQKVIIK